MAEPTPDSVDRARYVSGSIALDMDDLDLREEAEASNFPEGVTIVWNDGEINTQDLFLAGGDDPLRPNPDALKTDVDWAQLLNLFNLLKGKGLIVLSQILTALRNGTVLEDKLNELNELLKENAEVSWSTIQTQEDSSKRLVLKLIDAVRECLRHVVTMPIGIRMLALNGLRDEIAAQQPLINELIESLDTKIFQGVGRELLREIEGARQRTKRVLAARRGKNKWNDKEKSKWDDLDGISEEVPEISLLIAKTAKEAKKFLPNSSRTAETPPPPVTKPQENKPTTPLNPFPGVRKLRGKEKVPRGAGRHSGRGRKGSAWKRHLVN